MKKIACALLMSVLVLSVSAKNFNNAKKINETQSVNFIKKTVPQATKLILRNISIKL